MTIQGWMLQYLSYEDEIDTQGGTNVEVEILFLTHINRFTGLPDIDTLRCAAKGLARSAASAAKIYQTELAYAEAL